MPQLESKGAALMLAFMAGVSVGLVDKSAMMIPVAIACILAALWQFHLKDN